MSGNPNKRKGTQWEVDLKGFLNNVLGARTKVYRPAQSGFKDEGDLHGLSPFVAQAKNYRDLAAALRNGTDGAVKQAEHAGETYGVNFIKRARHTVAGGYAVMTVRQWAEFYRDYLDLVAENRELRRRLGE